MGCSSCGCSRLQGPVVNAQRPCATLVLVVDIFIVVSPAGCYEDGPTSAAPSPCWKWHQSLDSSWERQSLSLWLMGEALGKSWQGPLLCWRSAQESSLPALICSRTLFSCVENNPDGSCLQKCISFLASYKSMTLIHTLSLSSLFSSMPCSVLLGRQAQWATCMCWNFHSMMILFRKIVSIILHAACMQITVFEGVGVQDLYLSNCSARVSWKAHLNSWINGVVQNLTHYFQLGFRKGHDAM